jgi:hypothetical protein
MLSTSGRQLSGSWEMPLEKGLLRLGSYLITMSVYFVFTIIAANVDQVVRHASRYGLESSCKEVENVRADIAIVQYSNEYLKNGGSACDLDLGRKRGRAMTTFILALPGSTYLYQ